MNTNFIKDADILTNFNFLLRVDGVYDLPCKKIGGIHMEQEFETIQEGGVNDYVQLRKKPVSRPYTFEVERYVCSGYVDPLPLGKQPEMPIILYVSRYANDFTNPSRTFVFSGCTVTQKNYGDMEAGNAGLMTETMTIAYQTLFVEDNEKEVRRPQWKFDPGRNFRGTGKTYAAVNPEEKRKAEMQRQAKLKNNSRNLARK